MKKLLYASMGIFLTLAVGQVRAGVPVSVLLDAPATANQIQTMAQMLEEYALLENQLNELTNQFKQMEKDYKAVTGSRNLGEILNNPHFRQYLPNDWQNIYTQIRNGGYKGLSGAAKAIRDSTIIYDRCQNITNTDARKACEAGSVQAAQNKSFADDAYQTSVDRVNQIESLMRQINMTNDPKSIAELGARIQAEQAMLQNEQTKIALYQTSASAEQQLVHQQLNESTLKRFQSTTGNKRPADIDWN